MEHRSSLFGLIFIQKTRLKSLTKHVTTVFVSKRDKKKKNIFFFSFEKGFCMIDYHRRHSTELVCIKMVWVEYGCPSRCPGHSKRPWDGLGVMTKTKMTRDVTDSNVQTPSDRITCALEVAQHLCTTFCTPHWSKQHMNMKINKVVVMYLDTGGEIASCTSGCVSSQGYPLVLQFLFFCTPGHYGMRKYSCWCKTCSLVRGRGHDCVSIGNFLDVSGSLRSKLTVWKEDQFTVLSGQGIKERERRVAEWVAKTWPMTKPGAWGCVQARAQ